MLNDKTLAQLEAALDGDLGEDAAKSTPEGVFDEAETTRAEQSAATLATTLAGFVAVEALRQLYDRRGTAAANRFGAIVLASPDIDMDSFTSSVARMAAISSVCSVS